MKKLLLITLAIIGYTTVTNAQQKNLFPKTNKAESSGQHHWMFPPNQSNAAQKTTANTRLKSYSDMLIDQNTSQLVYSDSASVNYTGGYGGGYVYNNDGSDLEDVLTNLITTYYSWGGGVLPYSLGWGYDLGIKYDYGALHSYDDSIGTWTYDIMKVQTNYDAVGNMLTYEHIAFDSTTSTWFVFMKYLFTHDASNNCISIVQQYWDGTQLANIIKNDFAYNMNNQITDILAQSWNTTNNAWENGEKMKVTYSGSKISSIETEYWYSNTWNLNQSYLCHYGANGYIDYIESGYWQLATSSYRYDDKNTFTYDASNRVTTQTLEYNSGVTGKCNYSYNTDNYITHISDYQWDNILSVYIPHAKYNYYYESYSTATVDIKNDGGKLTIYPSPAKEKFNINLIWEEQQSFSVSIVDMQGKMWMSQSNRPSKELNESINIENLPSGNYQVIIQGTKGKISKKLSVMK